MLLQLLTVAVIVAAVVLGWQPVQALEQITRVRLFDSHSLLSEITVQGPVKIEPMGKVLQSAKLRARGSEVLVSASGKDVFRAEKVQLRCASSALLALSAGLHAYKPASSRFGQAEAPARHYRGSLTVTAAGGRLVVVNEVDTRSYITSVVGSESLPDFPLEALKAQTVLACTTASRAARAGALLGDSTEIQAYLGSDYERPVVKQAVAAVYGEQLTTQAKSRGIYYHSTCAGGTSSAAIFSGSKAKSDEGVICRYCKDSPFFKEHIFSVTTAECKNKLGFVPEQILKKDDQGRPLQVSISRDGRLSVISGYRLWLKCGRAFGWGAVPGLRYRLQASADNLVFVSSGAGHGIGLCQWGARAMALSGLGYKEILRHYFPNSCVSGGFRH
jgi:stage II sporulation protein D